MNQIIGMIFVGLIGLYIVAIVGHDLWASIRYFTARKSQGEILEKLGEERIANYGSRRRPMICGKYRVRFTDDMGLKCEDILIRREPNLIEGTHITVRYRTNGNGSHLVNDIYVKRMCTLLVMVLIVAIIVLVYNYTQP